MSAAKVADTETWPEAEEQSVADAYAEIEALLDPDKNYVVDWIEYPKTSLIVQRFSRAIPSEAVLIAREVDDDGKPVRSESIVAPILLPKFMAVTEIEELEDKLRSELAALADADARVGTGFATAAKES